MCLRSGCLRRGPQVVRVHAVGMQAALRRSREGRPVGGEERRPGPRRLRGAATRVVRSRGKEKPCRRVNGRQPWIQFDRVAPPTGGASAPFATRFTRRRGVLCSSSSYAGPRSMRWFRSNAGRDAWLALFALACQFVFTFGHVHLTVVGVAGTAAISAGAPSNAVGGPLSPRQKSPSGLTQDFCALCSNINLANALVLPAPPTIVPATSPNERAHWPLTATPASPRDHCYFDARGPPHA